MSLLNRLKDRVDLLQQAYRRLKVENAQLKNRVVEVEKELSNYKSGDSKEVESLKKLLQERESRIEELQLELKEKDREAEAIISKVETLLEELGDY